MNTPAHVVLSALVLGRGRWQPHWLPITAGALIPDLPMLGFYFYQRVVAANPERFIWGHAYFEPEWQALFDVFNSLPLIALGALIAWRAGSAVWLALFASMALHCLGDLPLHNEDAHAHFFPFSTWHFRSPVSYWDPRHFGLVTASAEALFVAGGALALLRQGGTRPWRVVGSITLGLYLVIGVVALSVWMVRT